MFVIGWQKLIFGRNTSTYTNQCFVGSMDMKDTYIIVNGEKIWSAISPKGETLEGILDKEVDSLDSLSLYALTTSTDTIFTKEKFKQPLMSSVGVMGESDYACYTSKSYYNNTFQPFNVFNDDNTQWHSVKSSSPYDITYYSKNPILLNNVYITNRTDDVSNVYPVSSVTIYGSTDNENFVEIGYTTNTDTSAGGIWGCKIDTSEYWNYIKLVFTSNYTYCALNKIKFDGYVLVKGSNKVNLLASDTNEISHNGLFKQFIETIDLNPLDKELGVVVPPLSSLT
jgi:hypothetical protein